MEKWLELSSARKCDYKIVSISRKSGNMAAFANKIKRNDVEELTKKAKGLEQFQFISPWAKTRIFLSYLIFALNYLGTTMLEESLRSFRVDRSAKRKRLCWHLQNPWICRSSCELDETDEFRQFHLDIKAKDKPVFPVHARILELCWLFVRPLSITKQNGCRLILRKIINSVFSKLRQSASLIFRKTRKCTPIWDGFFFEWMTLYFNRMHNYSHTVSRY